MRVNVNLLTTSLKGLYPITEVLLGLVTKLGPYLRQDVEQYKQIDKVQSVYIFIRHGPNPSSFGKLNNSSSPFEIH